MDGLIAFVIDARTKQNTVKCLALPPWFIIGVKMVLLVCM